MFIAFVPIASGTTLAGFDLRCATTCVYYNDVKERRCFARFQLLVSARPRAIEAMQHSIAVARFEHIHIDLLGFVQLCVYRWNCWRPSIRTTPTPCCCCSCSFLCKRLQEPHLQDTTRVLSDCCMFCRGQHDACERHGNCRFHCPSCVELRHQHLCRWWWDCAQHGCKGST